MDFKLAKIWISVIILIVFASCSSVKGNKKPSGEAIMYGMVYNEENTPVSNAEVFIDGKTTTFTDTQGRFMFISKQRDDFNLTLVKAGYETVNETFRFEPMDVIHIVMVNADQLLNQAELSMAEGRYHDVLDFCDRALALNSERIDASYLKALSLIHLREFELARIILEELRKTSGERDYIRNVLDKLPK